MVTHDYERGVISGLPKSVLDHVRRTGQLPEDAMSVNLRAVWEGLLWQKSHVAELPGMTTAEILRVRDGWDDAFDPVAWERMTGGKVPFSPAFDGMAPGPGDETVLDQIAGKPAPVLATDCSCGESMRDLFPTSAGCGDGGSGTVSSRREFSATPGSTKCVGYYTCQDGDLCACRELPNKVGVYAGKKHCDGHGGYAEPSKISCTYFKNSEGVGRCDCTVECADGFPAPTRSDGVGWDVCPPDERVGEEEFKVTKSACPPPGSGTKFAMNMTSERVKSKLDKCSPTRGYWDRNPPPDDEKTLRGCVTNRYHAAVQVWCCNQTGSYWLKKGQTRCNHQVDVDHVRTPDGQWWKFRDGMHAEVGPDGRVAFSEREPWIKDTAETLGFTLWGPVSTCGMDFGT